MFYNMLMHSTCTVHYNALLYIYSLSIAHALDIASDSLSGIEKDSVKLYGHNGIIFKWFPKREPAKVLNCPVHISYSILYPYYSSTVPTAHTRTVHYFRIHVGLQLSIHNINITRVL